jgi:hypothetical protein
VTLTRFVGEVLLDAGRILTEVYRFGFVVPGEFHLDLSASLATCLIPCLFDATALGVTHGERDGRERDNAVVATIGRQAVPGRE